METTHHGEDASPDNPPRQQKSGNTDEQTIALTKARLAIDEVDARIVELLKKRAEWVHEVGRLHIYSGVSYVENFVFFYIGQL